MFTIQVQLLSKIDVHSRRITSPSEVFKNNVARIRGFGVLYNGSTIAEKALSKISRRPLFNADGLPLIDPEPVELVSSRRKADRVLLTSDTKYYLNEPRATTCNVRQKAMTEVINARISRCSEKRYFVGAKDK